MNSDPLYGAIPVFVCLVPTSLAALDQTLAQMPVDRAVWQTGCRAVAIRVGTGPIEVLQVDPGAPILEYEAVRQFLGAKIAAILSGTSWVLVVEHLAIDARCWSAGLGMPWPTNTWCLREGAHGAWPDLLGVHDPSVLCRTLGFPESLALTSITDDLRGDALRTALQNQVQGMALLFHRQLRTLPVVEQRIALATWSIRRHSVIIDQERLAKVPPLLAEAMATSAESIRTLIDRTVPSAKQSSLDAILPQRDGKGQRGEEN